MIRKLQVKFVCIIMAVVTVMLTLMLTLQYRSTAASLESASLAALQSAMMNPMTGNRPGSAKRDPGQPCFTLYQSAWGSLVASGDGYFDLSDTETLLNIFDAARDTGAESGVLEEYSLRFLRVETPIGVRFTFADITAELRTLHDQLRNSIAIGLIGLAAFLVISILLSRWAIRPVEKAWEQQRQFVADASHELKTPLTVIMTNAELLQDSGYAEASKQQFASSILAMSRQMRGLVESLLQLARVDCGQSKAEVEKLDFSKLVEDAVLPFEPLYFEQGLTLESSLEPGIHLTGSQSHLRQVVEILLDNAQKYSTPGGTVRLRLEKQGRNQCLLRVSSPGAALSAQECKDIFKRFYRLDQARSMNHSYGLGLAIAQRIVTDHRGKIWAESAGGINTFCVTLPLT